MTTKNSKMHFCSLVTFSVALALSACGSGGSSSESEGQDTSRTAVTLELKTWAPWDGVTAMTADYDAETRTATLTHAEPDLKIAFSRQAISPVGKYRLQFSDKQGASRAQLGPVDIRQLTMDFASPAQSWVDISHQFPVDVEFAPGTEYINVRIIFTGEAMVGTFNMIPLGDNGEPIPLNPENDDQPVPDDPPPTF